MERDELAAIARIEATKLRGLPGVIAAGPGERWRAGRRIGEDVLVVTVEEKRPPDDLAAGEDLAAVLAPAPVDVQQASPLQLLFARPERFGLSEDALAELEERFGYPFAPRPSLRIKPCPRPGSRRPTSSFLRA